VEEERVVIVRRFHVGRLVFTPTADSPDGVGAIGLVNLAIDGREAKPIHVMRCAHGLIHLAYCETHPLPVWADVLEVREQIHEFIENAIREWGEEIRDGR
jgi:hypothetical protein